MARFGLRSWLVLLLLLPLQSWAEVAPSPSVEKRISLEEAKASETHRRALIDEHIAWQWVLAAKVEKRSRNPQLGVFVGMEGEMVPGAFIPAGTSQTLAWLTPEGKLIWSASVLQEKDGSILHRFRLGDGAWAQDDEGKQATKALHDLLGPGVAYEDLRNWLTGIPGRTKWPRHFVSGDNGIHPTNASLSRGNIEWSGWMQVETEKKQKMPMPGAWKVAIGATKMEFALVSFEGYAADELPNPSWPYLTGKKEDFLNTEEKPIVPDDELDFKNW